MAMDRLQVSTLFHLPQVLIISISFLKYIQEHWLDNHGQYPSLGFVALVYALHTCDQVKHLLQLKTFIPLFNSKSFLQGFQEKPCTI